MKKRQGKSLMQQSLSVFFNSNMKQNEREEICNMLQLHEADANTTYLGLPNTLGRNKNAGLGYLKDRMQKRIEGYDKKLLPKGGKEILLKTVVCYEPFLVTKADV